MREVKITKEPVELYKLLKFEGLVGSGGEAKLVIADGQISVNGEVETRKRKKLISGDFISFGQEKIRILLKQVELEENLRMFSRVDEQDELLFFKKYFCLTLAIYLCQLSACGSNVPKPEDILKPSGDTHFMEVIWGNQLKAGDYKYIDRFPHYVANGGKENIGRWHQEEIDLGSIYAELWGDPATARVIRLGLFCDSRYNKSASHS